MALADRGLEGLVGSMGPMQSEVDAMSETHGNPSDHNSHAAPAPPEPKTPLWLTAVGALLFLTVGLIWGLTPDSKDAGAAPGGAANTADAGAPARH
jgi:hypothetical protein